MTCLSDMSAEDKWLYIETGSLAELLKTGLDKVLLIDSRSFLEYNTSRIQQSVNVCCSKLAKRRLQQDKISIKDLLAQLCHIDMEEYSEIVVYDQCTADLSILTEDNFIIILLRKLKLNPAFNKVALLKGGYLSFQAMQPHLCENKSDSNYNCTPLTFLSQPCLPVSNVGPTRILPFLYLGSHRDAMSQETIQVNDISYILNVSTSCPRPPFIQEGHFFRIPINDNYSAKMLPFFEEAFQFIDKVREANGCVLVHCLAGISRSPTLAIAYIMKHLKMSSDDAYRYVKDKRPTISPNFNFLGQLLEFEKKSKHSKEISKHRQDGVSHDNKPNSIIAMDLQMCSPSSPKISKPFTFDSLWDSYNTSASSDESTKTLPLLRDNDTWADFTPMEMSKDFLNSRMCGDSKSNEENNNVEGRSKTVEKPKEIPYWPAPKFNMATTPCEETKTFPYTAIPPETDLPQRCSSSPRSPGRLSTSPKSPGKRSFTLPISPVPLSSETTEKSFSRICESVSYERVRLKSPRQSFSRPFSLPLSPVISPAEENISDNSPITLPSATCAISRNSIQTSVKCSVSISTTPVSRRSFSLALSSGLQAVDTKVNESKETSVCQSLSGYSNDHMTLTSTPRSTDTSTFVSNSLSRDLSPCVHTSETTTSFSPQNSVCKSFIEQKPRTFCSQTSEPLSLKVSSSAKTSEVQSCSFTSKIHKSDANIGNISTKIVKPTSVKEIRPFDLKISQCETDICSPSPVKRPSFSLALSTVISTDHSLSPSNSALNSKQFSQSLGKNEEKLSHFKSSHFTDFVEHKDVTKLQGIGQENKQTLKPSVPKSLAIPNSIVPNKKLCMSQNMSPSSAMAKLNFSQTLSDAKKKESGELQNYAATSLDKLNFTPCFSNSSSKLTRKKFPVSISCDSHTENEEMMVISPTETISPVSSSGSSSSGTITSPTSTCKVVRRSHEYRAKRPMERPNSIAFSKYPTFDLGSDCQDSPSSGSSTSQDDASEMYILQNGKRSKHSDTKLRIGHFSEKEVYKQISAAMESAMLRTKVYEANRKARSLDDMLASDEPDSPNHCSPFNRLPSHCMMGNDRFSSPIFDGCRTLSDPYQSNSSISSSGSHNSLQGSLEIIQMNYGGPNLS